MDIPLVYQLFCQGHGWVATYGRDKRGKHLSAKPPTRIDFPRKVRPVRDDHVDRSEV